MLYKKILLFGVAIIFLIIAIILQMRAFVLGYAIAISFLYFTFNHFKLKLKTILIISAAFILLLVVLIIGFKTGSSSGRILIYKVSWNMFRHNYLTGVGIGKVKIDYGIYQARYFRSNMYSREELLLADNTYFVFNDYWQWIIECGILGVISLIFMATMIYKIISKALKNFPGNPLLLFAIMNIIAVLAAAMFTHLFERLYFQIAIISLIAVVCYYAYQKQIKVSYFIVVIVLLNISISLITYWPQIINYKHYEQWRDADTLAAIGYKVKALDLYKNNYHYLADEPAFLYDYKTLLISLKLNNEAKDILMQLISKRTDYKYYQDIGKCYFEEHEYTKAESYYIESIEMVPNRFLSRYNLFVFYNATAQQEKAKQCGNAILKLPIKIPSKQIDDIIQLVKAKK